MEQQITRRTLLGGAGLLALGLTAGGLFGGDPAEAQSFPLTRNDAEWRQRLSPAAYRVLRGEGTERPWSSPLNEEKRAGIFRCGGCEQPLYSSRTKFESGTGWPSFWAALPRAVGTRTDRTLGMTRTEVHCARCGGHLGHIFDDGPQPTGQRHCINGVALGFVPA